jgi:hypothetical protein
LISRAMPPGATSVSDLTRSPARMAISAATAPPIEWPAHVKLLDMPASSSAARIALAIRPAPPRPSELSEPPCPGRSTAITRTLSRAIGQ